MNLTDYFCPVALDKPKIKINLGTSSFYKNIFTHTPDNPVKDITNYDIAILGVPEDRNALEKGASKAPDAIRSKLYQLSFVKTKEKIIDLGNLKQGNTINDTYAGLKDVLEFLHSNNIICVVIGGSQDLTLSMNMVFERNHTKYNLTTIDSRLNLGYNSEDLSSENYLDEIVNLQNTTLFQYTNLGHQTFFVDSDKLDYLQLLNQDAVRLGELIYNIEETEPFIRNSDAVSIDISAVKTSDATGQFYPSPNGFSGIDICQMAKYAGLSEKTKMFGIFEVNPDFDNNDQTSGLAAQMIWYFLQGSGQQCKEIPEEHASEFKKYVIDLDGSELVFYKSERSQRWWLEVKDINNNGEKVFVPCSSEDYKKACNNEVPDRWWKAFQKLN